MYMFCIRLLGCMVLDPIPRSENRIGHKLAAESRDFRCAHNLVYWRSGAWVGIGPGAHGRLGLAGGRRVGTRTERVPERWLSLVERQGHAEQPREPIGPADQLVELLMMGLRLAEGVPVARLEGVAGRPLEQALDGGALERLEAAGLLAREEGRLRATPAGSQRLDAVLRALLA